MRTLNDIVPPSRRKEMGMPPVTPDREPLNLSPRRPPSFPYLTLGIAALVIVVSIGALLYFSTAKIEVTPSAVSLSVDHSFTAGGGTLPYEIISTEKIATQSVKGSGTKSVSNSSSGMITIYNTQSKAQTLIKNTRFATTAGLIFRIHEAVTIPGGSDAKPGVLTVRVYADKPGAAYNVGPTSFTVPGFSGTPQASQVYARSTSSMSGGASGEVPAVDPSVEVKTKGELRTALSADLAKSLASQVPSGYLLVPGSATTTYDEILPTPSATSGMVDIKVQATLKAIVFPNAALAKSVATAVTDLSYQGEPVTITTPEELRLTAERFPSSNTETFSFSLSGTAALVYTIDEGRIAAAVAGKSRSAAEVAISNYPEVKRAIITLRPFWRQSFPQDPSTITVTVVTP